MFYDKYVSLCNAVDKSPSAVALEIGFSKPTVTKWKNGGKPTDATIQKVADYFGVTLEEMKGDPENKKTPTLEGERDYQSIVEAFEKADDSTRAVILRLLGLQ